MCIIIVEITNLLNTDDAIQYFQFKSNMKVITSHYIDLALNLLVKVRKSFFDDNINCLFWTPLHSNLSL